MHWGKLQRECHRLLQEVFPKRADGYVWLKNTFKISHFSELKYQSDKDKLMEIHERLWVMSFKSQVSVEDK